MQQHDQRAGTLLGDVQPDSVHVDQSMLNHVHERTRNDLRLPCPVVRQVVVPGEMPAGRWRWRTARGAVSFRFGKDHDVDQGRSPPRTP
ncbi:hypothetical protein ABTY98_02040 [Streptomyces sp. NPDC096040]|uniref:hypothetical protein n=1 Tax=Streptomyces sp. NPDC096040 TaxID=3155541 RepID=UPI0033312A88